MDPANLSGFQSVNLSLLPTPFHRLPRLSSALGIECYCKRDDMTGFGLGGNKTRKLDFLIGEALARRSTALVATGAVQSNFCRLAAAAGAAHGLAVHLVLGGTRPGRPAGNLLLDQLFGAQIRYVNSDDWNAWEAAAEETAARLTAAGDRVYRLPIGGSTPVGALGYVRCIGELMDDERRAGIRVNAVIHASSSGGTQAGLVVGKAAAGWHASIIGMGVAKTGTVLTGEVGSLAEAAGGLIGCRVDPSSVIVDQRAMGPGYAVETPECMEAIRMFAQLEGIVLDRVYTGKAAAGLISLARSGAWQRDSAVVFLHTGGIPELFA